MQINWYSPTYGTVDGYGSSAEQTMTAFEKLGGRVFVEQPFGVAGGETMIPQILQRPPTECSVRIAYCPPMQSMEMNVTAWHRKYVGQTLIGWSMWEDDCLPQIWEDPLKVPDLILVPNYLSYRSFSKMLAAIGVETPLHLVPLGVNPELYPANQRIWKRDEEPLKFLWTAGRIHDQRKGAKLAYRAFCDAFPNGENVKLVLRAAFDIYSPAFLNDEDPDWYEEAQEDPRVEIYVAAVPNEVKTEFLQRCHVLLYPSCGEGFGLVPLEAAATAMPSIITAGAGMDDYADDLQAMIAVPSTLEPSQIATRWQPRSRGRWRVIKHEAFVAALRDMYQHFDVHAVRAVGDARFIREHWTYDRTARLLAAAIETARARRMARMKALRTP
jgi:glycosyltransferase involved in cell wall biosynthesis